MSRVEIRLNPAIDIEAARAGFSAEGRVHIPGVFEKGSAQRIHKAIAENENWNLVFDLGGQHRDLNAAGMSQIGQEALTEFLRIVHAQAEKGFQYLFSNFPLYETYHRKTAPDNFLNRVFEIPEQFRISSLHQGCDRHRRRRFRRRAGDALFGGAFPHGS